ncbi:MAG: HepT-like ribonuclease domain-containing protein [Methanotrichaceae archaeon]
MLTHRYFELDVDLVWKAVTRDLPDLKEKITAILEEDRGRFSVKSCKEIKAN